MTLFDRVPTEYRHILDSAMRIVPSKVFEAISPRFMCGADPAFVGLHHYESSNGYSLASTCHAVFPVHSSDNEPRVVLPRIYKHGMVATAVHEIGHLFDFATGFNLEAPETTEYSTINRLERIAEAFETILIPPSGAWRDYTESEAFRPLRAAMGVLS